jgi:hypothetical protein
MAEGDGLLGWATDDLVFLDSLPDGRGLISRLLTVSPMRKQAIFLVLASRRLDRPGEGTRDEHQEASLAKVLRHGRAREIITHAFGYVADGLLGGLERLGDTPLSSPAHYVRHYLIFARPEHRAKAEALQHVGQITEKMLRVLDALDPRWVHAETLKRIECAADARDFNRAVAFAQAVFSRATDDVVAAAIARLQPTSTLIELVQRLVRRADRFPSQPVERTDDIRPLASTRDLIEAGRRYHNCLTTKLDEVLAGRVAFAEFRGDCIVEFRSLTGAAGWLLWEVHGHRNGPVPSALAAAATEECLNQGVPSVDESGGGADWRSYCRFVRYTDLFRWAA